MNAKTVVQLFLKNGRVELLVPYPIPEAEAKIKSPGEDGYVRLLSTDQENVEAVANFKDADIVGFLTFPLPKVVRPTEQRLIQ